MLTNATRVSIVCFCIAVSLGLSACSSMQVAGRVVPGAISYVGVVDGSDSRLSVPGLQGVEVRISAPSGSGSNENYGRAMTKADGSFTIKLDSSNWPTDRVHVRATVTDYAAARGLVFLPTEGKKLLILMERTAGD